MNNTLTLTLLSLLLSTVFCVYHIILGVITHSWWLFTVGVYYAILSIIRFIVLRIREVNSFVTKFTGIMLMLLSLSLVGTVILAVVRDRGVVMHEIVMISMAVYSFMKITLAIINLVKARKGTSVKLIILRNVSLSNAFVSIFALQRSMLVSFGDMSERDICIFNAATGSLVCVIVFLIGLNLMKSRRCFQDTTK